MGTGIGGEGSGSGSRVSGFGFRQRWRARGGRGLGLGFRGWDLGQWGRALQSYLTQCINQMVLEGQFPHKFVNVLFTITN